ncbi:MAG TPA: hypothetical protein VF759_02875 [Allosphingosinicella sp.]
MTNTFRIGLGAAAAAALLAGGALYANAGGPRGPMAKFDSDGNGAVSLAEARAGAAKMFEGADSNKDGRVTQEEMRAFHAKMGHGKPGGHHRGGGHHGGPPKGDAGRGPMHLDSDGDGALSLAEAQSGIERHFVEIDSNRDGSITEAEMRAAHEAHRGARR